MDAGSAVEIRIKRGQAVRISAPLVLILPEDSVLKSVVLHGIMLGDGRIEVVSYTQEKKRKKPR